ncbi:hypothetical protein [Psychromonas sp. SP041]|uniref:hypothetical protein n=1 Tax=Psychromonas sp. SP041 TaxID=1365007 RepID=UPI00046F5628|nr:hypothetical protein [Psychromonas sp. SP041]
MLNDKNIKESHIDNVVCAPKLEGMAQRGITLYIEQSKLNKDGSVDASSTINYESSAYFNRNQESSKDNPIIHSDRTTEETHILHGSLVSKDGENNFVVTPEGLKVGLSYTGWMNLDKDSLSVELSYRKVNSVKDVLINGYRFKIPNTGKIDLTTSISEAMVKNIEYVLTPDAPLQNIRSSSGISKNSIKLFYCPIYLPSNTVIDTSLQQLK